MTQIKRNIVNNYKLEGLQNDYSSPLIWLLHGAGGDMEHFKFISPVLIAHGFRVLLFDVRYHGLSQPKEDMDTISFSFSDVIQDMKDTLKEIKKIYYHNHNEKIPLFLAGLSMGGMISLLFAANEHKNIKYTSQDIGFELKGVIPIASGIPNLEIERPGWDIYRERKATMEILEFTKASIISSALSEVGQQETERAIKLISNKALYECLVEIANFLPLPSDSSYAYEPTTRLPMLLILPDHDVYTKPEMKLLHKINLEYGIDSRFLNIENAGHMVILDQGEQVSNHIVEFCNSL